MRLAEAWSRSVGLRIAVISGFAGLYIWLAGPAPPVQDDSIHDYSLVRLCLDGHGCFAHGTSIEGIDQGRLLLFVLAGMSRVGLTPYAQHLVFIGLSAAAVVVLSELARTLADARAGLITAGLAAWAVPTAADHPLLWNPTLASLPLAVMTASCVEFARSERLIWLLGFTLGLVFAYHGHVVHLVAWPAATLLVGAATDRPAAWALAVLGPALGLLAFDTAVFVANARAAMTTPIGWLFPLAVLAGIPIGARLRPRWQALPDARRGPLALAWLGGVVVACVGLGALVADLPFVGRYLAASVPALVVLAGVAVASIEHRRAQLALTVIVALFVTDRLIGRLRYDGMWSFFDVGVIDELLRGEGDGGLPERGPWIRAPDGPSLVNAARVFGFGDRARAYPEATTQLLPLTPAACPEVRALEGWGCVRLGWRTSLAWAEDRSPWIDPEQLEVCAVFGDAGERCVAVEVADPIHERPAGSPRVVELHALATVEDGEARAIPSAWRQRLRVSTELGGRRLILLARDWTLVFADGIDAEPGPTVGPRRTIWLAAEPGSEGVVTIERDADGASVGSATPAIASELEEAEQAVLLDLIAR